LDPLLNSINNNTNNTNIYNNNINNNTNISNNIPIPNSSNNNINNNTIGNNQIQIKEKGNNILNPIYADNTKIEFNYETLVNITNICAQKQTNNKNTYIALGMEDGSVLIWDTELQCDKYLFQDNTNEILSISLDNNYLLTTSRDGKVFIYDLVKGQNLFNCYHNPYKNFPVFYVKKILNFFILLLFYLYSQVPFFPL
jgi:WD40 repeat protein